MLQGRNSACTGMRSVPCQQWQKHLFTKCAALRELRTFNDSGSSARPGYPGFMVMKAITLAFRVTSTLSNPNRSLRARSASSTVCRAPASASAACVP